MGCRAPGPWTHSQRAPEAIEAALATGMAAGAIESWDRLEALLASL